MIRLLMNLKLRRKLMIAMAPLALMVVLAGLYASYQIKWIDKQYSELIDNDIKTLQSVTSQRALTMRFGMSLYNLIAETDPQRVRLIDSELDTAQEAIPSGTRRLAPPESSPFRRNQCYGVAV